jgi:hypothetical protein
MGSPLTGSRSSANVENTFNWRAISAIKLTLSASRCTAATPSLPRHPLEVIGMNQLVAFTDRAPAIVAAAGERAETRFWEFFVSNIRNPHTRRAYGRSIAEFLAWCEQHGLASIVDVEPLHVGAYIEAVTRSHSAPTAKQKLAAIRMLFDWLVTGQIVPTNPAASVRGPKHIVKVGKTAVLDVTEARVLLDSM